MKRRTDLVGTLSDFTKPKRTNSDLFGHFHRETIHDPLRRLSAESEESLTRFLHSTMDEVRLHHASVFSRAVLNLIDSKELNYFRTGLLRKEVVGDIEYHRQRDHSAHTLYNYLLGWYIFAKVKGVRDQFEAHIQRRGIPMTPTHTFGSLWPFVSITHDIGYLLEGSLDLLSPTVRQERLMVASEVIHDFFHHHFWIVCHVDSVFERTQLLEKTGIALPEFRTFSLTGVADALRNVGNVVPIQEALRQKVKDREDLTRKQRRFLRRSIGDTFDLWENNYDYYGLAPMKRLVRTAREFFEYGLSEGLAGPRVRILDHGVCSGLLVMLYSAFYFRMFHSLDANPSLSEFHEQLKSRFSNGGSYEAEWWWQGIVWATAAAALHNVVQCQSDWPKQLRRTSSPKLSVDKDPLAYLGILVDVLQEWDRYSVRADSILRGEMPVQGVDMMLGTRKSSGKTKVLLVYPDNRVAKEVRDKLNETLADWRNIVIVEG